MGKVNIAVKCIVQRSPAIQNALASARAWTASATATTRLQVNFVDNLKNFAKGDVLIAISGSGNSPTRARAVEQLQQHRRKTTA